MHRVDRKNMSLKGTVYILCLLKVHELSSMKRDSIVSHVEEVPCCVWLPYVPWCLWLRRHVEIVSI